MIRRRSIRWHSCDLCREASGRNSFCETQRALCSEKMQMSTCPWKANIYMDYSGCSPSGSGVCKCIAWHSGSRNRIWCTYIVDDVSCPFINIFFSRSCSLCNAISNPGYDEISFFTGPFTWWESHQIEFDNLLVGTLLRIELTTTIA